MAALTITAANIVPVSGFSRVSPDPIAATTIAQGEACYINSSSLAALAQCDGTATEATVAGIAVNAALAGQPVCLQSGGSLGFGAILTAGTPYAVGRVAGQIIPVSDLASTDKISYLGIASTTSNLVLGINNTGVTKA